MFKGKKIGKGQKGQKIQEGEIFKTKSSTVQWGKNIIQFFPIYAVLCLWKEGGWGKRKNIIFLGEIYIPAFM